MSYTDGETFSQQMKGGGNNIICMEQMFGVPGCPSCAKAKILYNEADAAGESRDKPGPKRKEAKSFYHRKVYWAYSIVLAPGKPQDGKLCLVNYPTQRVEELLKNVMHQNPVLRWSDPANITEGHCLGLTKFEKSDGTDYAQYSLAIARDPYPLDAAWWEQTRVQLPSLDSPTAIQIALDKWAKDNIFVPYSEMQKGDVVMLRLLPHNVRPGAVPFIQLKVHFSSVQTPWDKAWADVGYDATRAKEVLENPQVVMQQQAAGVVINAYSQAPAPQLGLGYAGTPAVGGGVTLPSFPQMDNLPY